MNEADSNNLEPVLDAEQAAFVAWLWESQEPLVRVEGIPLEVYVRRTTPGDAMMLQKVRGAMKPDDPLTFVRWVATMARKADGSLLFDPNDDAKLEQLDRATVNSRAKTLDPIRLAFEAVNESETPPAPAEDTGGN